MQLAAAKTHTEGAERFPLPYLSQGLLAEIAHHQAVTLDTLRAGEAARTGAHQPARTTPSG